jgi:hypothetical protein
LIRDPDGLGEATNVEACPAAMDPGSPLHSGRDDAIRALRPV